jgi:hypothetical protein
MGMWLLIKNIHAGNQLCLQPMLFPCRTVLLGLDINAKSIKILGSKGAVFHRKYQVLQGKPIKCFTGKIQIPGWFSQHPRPPTKWGILPESWINKK